MLLVMRPALVIEGRSPNDASEYEAVLNCYTEYPEHNFPDFV